MTKYFEISEFDSPDAPGSGFNMQASFINRLVTAREIAGVPFRINSGYRTPEHNRKVGGTPGSSHLTGWAADIAVKDNRERGVILNALIRAGFSRIGIGKTFLHVDSDPSKNPAVWLY